MALAPLATPDDLAARGLDVSDTALVDTMLAVASASVRAAAGSPIAQTTSTVKLSGGSGDRYLRLPGPPIRSVELVLVDGIEVTDWRLQGDRLWRAVGWGDECSGPVDVDVTYTHGLPEVPEDVVDLVCSLAAAGMAAATGGDYGLRAGIVAERIGDYSVTYAQGAEAVASVMELPRRTKQLLRARFGGSAGTVRHR